MISMTMSCKLLMNQEMESEYTFTQQTCRSEYEAVHHFCVPLLCQRHGGS